MLHEHKVLLQVGEKGEIVRKKSDEMGAAVTPWKLSMNLDTNEKFNKSELPKVFTTCGIQCSDMKEQLQGVTKSPVTNWRTHADVYDGEFRRNFRALKRWRLFFKTKCYKQRRPAIPRKNAVKNYRIGGRAQYKENSRRKLDASLTYLQHRQGYIIHNPSRREKVDSPCQTSRPAEGNPSEQIPSTSTAQWDTRSVADESSSERKEAEKFDFELWPQASKFGSWKVTLRREVIISGSTHPRWIREWSAKID